MPYSTTINTFRFSLVLLGFITLVACGDVEDVALPVNEAPTASRVTITDDNAGDFVVGDSLTGNYIYADAENDAEDVSIYRWLRNGEFIGGATTSNYLLVAADIGQSITFEVTPVAVTGTTIGSAVSSISITVNSVPVADAGAGQAALVGDTMTLNGSASSDIDGDSLTYRWSFTSKPVLSAAVLSDPATVNPSFDIDVSGDYVVQLIVNDGKVDSAADTVTISTTNSAPVANAGADQTPLVGETMTLNGSASFDVDGDPLTYSWSFNSVPSGSLAALSDTSGVNPSFDIDVPGDYVVQLIVNDGAVDSVPDTVTISTSNSAPVANAGTDQTPLLGETVALNGSASSDVDGDPLTYSWSLTVPLGSLAALSDTAVVNPSFDIDEPGEYVAQLIVNDGVLVSAPDTVSISTSNSAPVANAGPDQSPLVGETVALNGSASSDVDGDGLTFSWSLTTVPSGSLAALSDTSVVNPSFDIDVSGDYVVQLIVNDGMVDSVPDTVTISTSNSAPVANAGPDQSPLVGETVALNGSASSDVDGDPLTYSWSLTVPSGSLAALSDTAVVNPSFDIDVPGEYVAQLIVKDGVLDSAPDTVTISTSNSAPVANAGPDQSPLVGDTVTLDGSASSDVDGDPLTYSWSLTVPLGSGATLSDIAAISPTFIVDLPGEYVAQLIVKDGVLDSAPDTVTISTSNSAPVANAGPDQSPLVGDTVTLDGSASSDVDGDPLTYSWSLTVPLGSGATLSDIAAISPTFIVDLPGEYVAQLIVKDGVLDSAPDTVTISTSNSAPVANAGPDQSPLVGDTVTLDGSASSDVDGDPLTYSWSLTVPLGSGATLSDIAAISPTFIVDLPGEYVAQLIVKDGVLDSAPDTVTISTSNSAPVANAGPDQSPLVGDTVTLDGSGSSDVDGDPLTYSWSLTVPLGSGATLSDIAAISPTFIVDLPGEYVAQLIVKDGVLDSAPDTVTISTSNSAPVANAGPDQSPLVGDTVTLDGSGSSDVDGDPLTYSWSLTVPLGSGATLSDIAAISPTFIVDLPGEYVAQLIVKDGVLDSAPDTVTISTSNSAPVANAGPDQSPLVGDTVTLDGSGSSDVDGDPLTYSWSLTVPLGSGATLSDIAAISPTFIVDLPGEYVAQLIVKDGVLDSAPDTVTISTSNSAPVANAGPDQSPLVGDTVTLDGSGSSDVDGDPLTYSWSLTVPLGSGATLSDTAAISPTFIVDLPGEYVAQLIVKDGVLDSAPDTVTISTSNSAPVANAGPDQSPLVGDTVTLDGSGSSDVDGDPLTYSWSLTVPLGSGATLSDIAAISPTFIVDLPGEYVAQLIVNDGALDSAPDTVAINP